MNTNAAPIISLIAAISAQNRALGKDNKLLWHLPGDLKRFKQLTTSHAVIMGRKTYESIGKPLPNRTNVVVTRTATYKAEGCKVVTSLEDALAYARALTNGGSNEVFIIGGAEIYAQALPFANRLYLTLIENEPEADTFFPDYSAFTKQVGEKVAQEENGIRYSWVTLER